MINSNIFMVLFFSLFIATIIYVIKISLITDGKRIKLVKEAMEKNHVIKGKLVRTKTVKRADPDRRDDNDSYELYKMGIYEYEYNKRTYKTKIMKRLRGYPLQKEIDLFYVKNPKKATTESSLGKTEISWLKYFIITFILLYILTIAM